MEVPPAAVVASDTFLAGQIARRERSDQMWQKARAACGQLYSRHAPRLVAFLSARVNHNDVDDLHQAIWQRVWERLPSHFDGSNFRAWLYQIARNLAIDQGRKKRPERLGEESEPSDPDAGPEEALQEEEALAALQRCLGELDAESAALVRARLAGEGYAEIAARLSLEPERAHKLFHQAKLHLQACIQRVLG
jgi:RNA polymerase sigma-70 factor (ECF subfamily)